MTAREIHSNVHQSHADYLRDESRRNGSADCIAFPENEDDVIDLIKSSHGPVTVQGARTGITGGAVPDGGLIINLSRMNSIGNAEPLKLDDGRMSITVQPGALLSTVRTKLTASGAGFFPPDPTENSASIGGMIACNASGARSFKYGPTRNYINSLRVVTAKGDVIALQRGKCFARGRAFSIVLGNARYEGLVPGYVMPAVKNASGYFSAANMDLIDLFIGSEGTLGIVTEASLMLAPTPAFTWAITAFFPNVDASLSFVSACRQSALPSIAAIEFFDRKALELLMHQKATNSAFSFLPELDSEWNTCVYVELEGEIESQMAEATETIAELISSCGGSDSATWMATEPIEMERAKKFRHAVPEAVNLTIDSYRKREPAITKLGTDFAVPPQHMKTVVDMYLSGLSNAGLDYVMFGHIGDSHLHVNILPRTMDEYTAGKALYLQWAKAVIALGGTVSAEHGIGKMKTKLLAEMFGPQGVDEMRLVKSAFDPEWRLNCGNLFEVQ